MCMTLIAGRKCTQTGFVMVGHNEDDDVHASVRHLFVEAKDRSEGDFLPSQDGKNRVKHPEHAFGYGWMQVKGPEGGLPNADSFVNENGVCIVSNSSCGSKEKTCPENGIVYEFRLSIAERAKSARHALQIAIELLETFGYAAKGRIYTFADKNEAYMIQIAMGHRYIAARVPDDAVVVMSNHYTIHTLRDVPEMFYPKDLVEHAMENGWYDPAKDGEFDFAKAYQNPERYHDPENTLRQKYATEILVGEQTGEEPYPFCVKCEKLLTRRDFMAALSTHYEGTPDDLRSQHNHSPHTTSVRRVCTYTTIDSCVYEFGDRLTAWTAFGRPCVLPYIPLHPLEFSLDSKFDGEIEAEKHFEKAPGATEYDGERLWQHFKDIEGLAELRYNDVIDILRNANEGLLTYYENTEIQSDGAAVRKALERLECLNLANAEILSVMQEGARFTVEFAASGTPLLPSLKFVNGRSVKIKEIAKATEIARVKEGIWRADFVFEEAPLAKDGPGNYEFMLGGQAKEGHCFAGETILHLQ